jgi:glycosyltransferase involved in cell wall biosynthesis
MRPDVMRSGLVSVIIPCFNSGAFLGECLRSVFDQTYRPLEVIVVDDGSTDDSVSVARPFPLTLICQSHAGVCAAVNHGVAASSGEFVLRVDADDLLDPAYVERMFDVLRTDLGAAFAYSHGRFIGARTGPFNMPAFDAEALAEGAYATSVALTRRTAYDAAGGYDEQMAELRCEDWDLWLTYAELGLRGVRVDEPLWSYRRHQRASRNTLRPLSLAALRREWRLIARLQDKHSRLFTSRALLKRLWSLRHKLATGETTPRQALLLLVLYGVMLSRSASRVFRLNPPRASR